MPHIVPPQIADGPDRKIYVHPCAALTQPTCGGVTGSAAAVQAWVPGDGPFAPARPADNAQCTVMSNFAGGNCTLSCDWANTLTLVSVYGPAQ